MYKEPKRVLHILNGLGSGGTESFIMNVYRNINRSKVQFDFLIRNTNGNILIDEINSMGGRVYISHEFPRHFIKNYKEINEFFKEHKDYKIIHLHANALMYVKPLEVAVNYGIKCRIIHSHNTQTANNPLYKYIHKWNKKFISQKATDFFACSQLAGEWMFNDEFQIINNAIDVNKFKFNEKARNSIRAELNLENKFVIGNIARFTEQKNHMFLIDIFYEVVKKNNNAVLLLVGSGELESNVRERIANLRIQENVVFAGVRNDIPDLLSAMDIFLLPSLFEGLGIVLVEAQANGLKCLASDSVIPEEAKLTNLLEFISLKKNSKQWATKILQNNNKYERKNMYEEIKASGYDILDVSRKLENYYLQHTEED